MGRKTCLRFCSKFLIIVIWCMNWSHRRWCLSCRQNLDRKHRSCWSRSLQITVRKLCTNTPSLRGNTSYNRWKEWHRNHCPQLTRRREWSRKWRKWVERCKPTKGHRHPYWNSWKDWRVDSRPSSSKTKETRGSWVTGRVGGRATGRKNYLNCCRTGWLWVPVPIKRVHDIEWVESMMILSVLRGWWWY